MPYGGMWVFARIFMDIRVGGGGGGGVNMGVSSVICEIGHGGSNTKGDSMRYLPPRA